jgi:hypothetical protein
VPSTKREANEFQLRCGAQDAERGPPPRPPRVEKKVFAKLPHGHTLISLWTSSIRDLGIRVYTSHNVCPFHSKLVDDNNRVLYFPLLVGVDMPLPTGVGGVHELDAPVAVIGT